MQYKVHQTLMSHLHKTVPNMICSNICFHSEFIELVIYMNLVPIAISWIFHYIVKYVSAWRGYIKKQTNKKRTTTGKKKLSQIQRYQHLQRSQFRNKLIFKLIENCLLGESKITCRSLASLISFSLSFFSFFCHIAVLCPLSAWLQFWSSEASWNLSSLS